MEIITESSNEDVFNQQSSSSSKTSENKEPELDQNKSESISSEAQRKFDELVDQKVNQKMKEIEEKNKKDLTNIVEKMGEKMSEKMSELMIEMMGKMLNENNRQISNIINERMEENNKKMDMMNEKIDEWIKIKSSFLNTSNEILSKSDRNVQFREISYDNIRSSTHINNILGSDSMLQHDDQNMDQSKEEMPHSRALDQSNARRLDNLEETISE